MAEPSYYDILGVKPDASERDIQQAYRKLVRRYHPDISDDPQAAAMTSKLNQAYNVLKNKEKRAEYDARLQQPFAPTDAEAQDHFAQAFAGGHFRFDDLFSAFGRGHRQGPVRGEDQHAQLQIDLETAYSGAVRTLTLPTDDGRSTTLKVTIPKGIGEGQQIRLSGQGLSGRNGGPAGDLYLKIHFRSDARGYVDQQKDVHLNAEVFPWQMVLGASLTLDTPAGKFKLKLPAGAQAGQKIRLKGRGIPAREPGDLYVHLKVKLPTAKDEKARALWQALEQYYAEQHP